MSNKERSDRPCQKCGEAQPLRYVGDGTCVACKSAAAAARYKADPATYRARNKAWKAANPERDAARVAAWHKANLDRGRASSAAWRKAHPEEYLASAARARARTAADPVKGPADRAQRREVEAERRRTASPEQRKKEAERSVARFKANPEHMRSVARAWREAHRDVLKAHAAAWRKANPDKMRDIQRRAGVKRRLRILGQQEAYSEAYRAADIFDRDGWVCHLCDQSIDPLLRYPAGLSASIDHVVAISKGGADSASNVRAAHRKCNLLRNNRSIEWVRERLVAP